ncbi:winged helix-turn-helix domain-containing protein [Halovivax limisalsi]|uniref:winged helix-turn-helix domain-containing protein n=1 Tax=Halovivax limisalsi TaxID=1453760 RepID=UPI001FFDD36D|nr:helix-turn-helix domain-containing protein [Halovivax limisalsi]
MSQSTMTTAGTTRIDRTRAELDPFDTEADVNDVLGAFEDPDCRSILTATTESARSASELAEDCDLPLSTTYRKLDRLTDAGLLEEGIRIRRSGKHTSEYSARLEEFVVSVTADDGVTISVTR